MGVSKGVKKLTPDGSPVERKKHQAIPNLVRREPRGTGGSDASEIYTSSMAVSLNWSGI